MGIFSRIIALAAALALGGCMQIHLTQADDTLLVRHGEFDRELPARAYARHYLPYAVFALKAYDEKGVPSERWTKGLTPQRQRDAERWILGWSKMADFDSYFDPALACRGGRLSCRAIPGLGYQVWVRDNCSEAVVAFRGTNFSEWADWITNFHWVTRALPVFDQYEQVQDNIDVILRPIARKCGKKEVPIVATGHSLGGGLAQQAAYMSRRIRRVVVFDPSMVTGSSDSHSKFEENRFGLQIERVYEHGEVLAYPRLLVRSVLANSVRNPMVRSGRFNHIHGRSILGQHSIATLTSNILEFAGRPPGNGTRPLPCDRAGFLAQARASRAR